MSCTRKMMKWFCSIADTIMGQKFGQHFLHDQEILSHIAQEADGLVEQFECMSVLEIWPWRGALTKHLMQRTYRLILNEVDTSLQWLLKDLTQGKNISIVRWDVLQQELVTNDEGMVVFWGLTLDVKKTLVVGNLPYYITSPILRKFFEGQDFPGGVFLIQKEVADKVRRDAEKKSYLRRLLNRTHQVRYAFTVKAESFTPPPNVTSAVIVIEKLASARLENCFEERLLSFLNVVSPFKRKTLGKIQKMQKEQFEHLGLSLPEAYLWMRLEELWWEEMRKIVCWIDWLNLYTKA